MASNAKHKSFMASNMLNEVLSEHFPRMEKRGYLDRIKHGGSMTVFT